MLRNLEAEMARKSITNADIAKAIAKDERTVRNKTSGKSQFTFPEVVKIRDTFWPELTLEYLFAVN